MTGGLFASTISVAKGAMEVLKGGIVAYDTDIKIQLLKVSQATIENHTAESQETTDEMCIGLQELYPDVELFVAITGVAEETPANRAQEGQVFISIIYQNTLHRYDTIIQPKDMGDKRNAIRIQTVKLMMERILYIVTRPPVAGMVAPEM